MNLFKKIKTAFLQVTNGSHTTTITASNVADVVVTAPDKNGQLATIQDVQTANDNALLYAMIF